MRIIKEVEKRVEGEGKGALMYDLLFLCEGGGGDLVGNRRKGTRIIKRGRSIDSWGEKRRYLKRTRSKHNFSTQPTTP